MKHCVSQRKARLRGLHLKAHQTCWWSPRDSRRQTVDLAPPVQKLNDKQSKIQDQSLTTSNGVFSTKSSCTRTHARTHTLKTLVKDQTVTLPLTFMANDSFHNFWIKCHFYLVKAGVVRTHEDHLTIRPVARKGYGSIAHEAKPNGLLIRGPWGRRV